MRRRQTARQADRHRLISCEHDGMSAPCTRAAHMKMVMAMRAALTNGEAARDMPAARAREVPSHFRAPLHAAAHAEWRLRVQQALTRLQK